MDPQEVAAMIDHCVLGPQTTPDDVRRVVDEVRDYGMNAACIPACFIRLAVEYGPDVPVLGGIGGSTAMTESKRDDTLRAYHAGAKEIDMTINVPRLKAGHERIVRRDVEAVVNAVPVPVKAIIETPLLDRDEIHLASQIAADAGADYIKNTTGAVGREDTDELAEIIGIMSGYLPTKVSAVSTWDEAELMLEAGAERIGTGSGPQIVEGCRAAQTH